MGFTVGKGAGVGIGAMGSPAFAVEAAGYAIGNNFENFGKSRNGVDGLFWIFAFGGLLCKGLESIGGAGFLAEVEDGGRCSLAYPGGVGCWGLVFGVGADGAGDAVDSAAE